MLDSASIPEPSTPVRNMLDDQSLEKGEKQEDAMDGVQEVDSIDHAPPALPLDVEALKSAFKRAAIYSSALSLIVVLIGKLGSVIFDITLAILTTDLSVPLPMFFSHYVFSRPFYTFWVSATMQVSASLRYLSAQADTHNRIWALLSGMFCIVLPFWESKTEIWRILSSCIKSF